MRTEILKYVELGFGLLGFIGLYIESVPRWVVFFCFFVFLALDLFVSLREGAVSSKWGPFGAWFYTYRRDEWPVLYMWCVMIHGLLTVGFLFAFLFSL
jgi:hypothetical protein